MKHTWRTRLASALLVAGVAGGVLVATGTPAMAASYVSCYELETKNSRAVPAIGGMVYYGVYANFYAKVKIIDQTASPDQTVYQFELQGPAERYSELHGLNPSHSYYIQIYCNWSAQGYIG